jgi:hypothetical protein
MGTATIGVVRSARLGAVSCGGTATTLGTTFSEVPVAGLVVAGAGGLVTAGDGGVAFPDSRAASRAVMAAISALVGVIAGIVMIGDSACALSIASSVSGGRSRPGRDRVSVALSSIVFGDNGNVVAGVLSSRAGILFVSLTRSSFGASSVPG